MTAEKSSLRRNDPSVIAADTRRILADPTVVRALDEMREELVRAIETTPCTGTPEDTERHLEMGRMLRTLRRMRSGMNLRAQLDDLRAANFQTLPTEVKKDGI